MRLLRTTTAMANSTSEYKGQIGAVKASLQDEKVFPFEKYFTKLKKQFRELEKDRHASYLGSRQVETLLCGMNTTDAGMEAAVPQHAAQL